MNNDSRERTLVVAALRRLAVLEVDGAFLLAEVGDWKDKKERAMRNLQLLPVCSDKWQQM